MLKLLIEEFAPGDSLVATRCHQGQPEKTPELSCLGALTKDGSQKLLIVNHLNAIQPVQLSGFGAGGVTLKIVDPKSVQVASSQGIRSSSQDASKPLSLEAFAVVVASRAASSAIFV